VGFASRRLIQAREFEDVIRELVEYTETIDEVVRTPIGFLNRDAGGAQWRGESHPVGFLPRRPSSERITADRLHKILFDINSGLFEFQRGEPN
jgi:hypothetical protein